MKLYSPMSRRDVLRTGGAVSLVAAGQMVFPYDGAFGAANMQMAQVAGFYRFMVGKFEITVISDGNLVFPTNIFGTNVPEAEVKAFLRSNLQPVNDYYAHTNLCVINTGKQLFLVDAGSGANFQPPAGKVLSNLKAAGYKPEEVDGVIITHAHPDHVWGIIDDFENQPRFPKAEYYIESKEWDFWTADDVTSKLPSSLSNMAAGTKRNLVPVSARTKRIDVGKDITTGIQTLDTSGHTVGHMSLLISSENDRLLILGDVVHHAYISFERPDWHMAYDQDPAKGAESRKKLLEMAVSESLPTVGFHLPFPGKGMVARKGPTFRWMPVNWQWTP